MSGKQIGGVVCLVLAALFLVGGLSSVFLGKGPALTDSSGLGVSQAVGAFLPCLIALIVGLYLLKKPGPGNPS